MKTLRTLFVIAIAVFGSSIVSFGQITANDVATTSSTIIAPITILKNQDMDFGTITRSGTLGTVELTAGGIATATGGVKTLGSGAKAAQFTTTGEGTYAYTISLPTEFELSNGATGTMTVDTFVSTPDATKSQSFPGELTTIGSQVINVGATLHVKANQEAGHYTNADGLVVTVQYN